VIRPARPEDREAVLELLQEANLPADGLDEYLENVLVARDDDAIVGCVGAEYHGSTSVLRSLAVRRDRRRRGIGVRLARSILERARAAGVTDIVLLTTTIERLAQGLGFRKVARETIDAAVREASPSFRCHACIDATCMRFQL
jgi:N-acetylglutamate synthase-like GNAT family acetyltransferase